MIKQLVVMSYEFGVREPITIHALQIKKVSLINVKCNTQDSKLRCPKEIAL